MNAQNINAFQHALDSLASLLPAVRQNKKGFQLPQGSSLSHSTGTFFKQTAWEKVALTELPKQSQDVPKQTHEAPKQSQDAYEQGAISMHMGDYFKQVSWLEAQSTLNASVPDQAHVLPGSTVIGNSVFGFFANTAWSGASQEALENNNHSTVSQSSLPEEEPEMTEQVENFFADIRW